MERFIRLNFPGHVYSFYAGFVLSIIAVTSLSIFVRLVKSARAGTFLAELGSDVYSRAFYLVLISILFLMGLAVWYVGWEGKTGIFYGSGALLGGLLTEVGVGKLIKSGK